jgi:SPP1 gp7 family putative phage head morphogenesis protein
VSLNSILADEMRERAVWLARYDAAMKGQAVALLKRLERDVVTKMSELEDFGELTQAGRARLEAIITWARSTIANAYKGVNEAAVEQLVDLAKAEVAFVERTMDKSVGVKLLDTAVTPAGIAEIVSNTMIRGNPMEDWWAGQAADLGRKFASEMRLGMLAGETLGQLIQRVRGTQAGGYEDGIMAVSRRGAAALVRTAVQTVSNNTRMKVYKDNDDVVGSLQHVSTLDDRTTDVCKARDGLRWKLNGEPIGHDMKFDQPPLHWNCRSTLIPVTKTWAEMGFDVDELTPGQRASMDGAVPADMTYEQWLKGKSEEFQNRVLGVEKAQMWRDGEITFRDLVDQTGRPLTIEEMQDRVTERDLVDEAMFEGVGEEVSGGDQPSFVSAFQRDDQGNLLYKDTDPAQLKQAHRSLTDYINEFDSEGVRQYVSSEWEDINKALLGDAETEEAQLWLSDLKSATKPLSESMLVYRGTMGASGKYGGVKEGSVLRYNAYTSTSSSFKMATHFGEKRPDPTSATSFVPVVIEMKLEKGAKAIVTNAKEMEVILAPNTRMEVVSVSENVTIKNSNGWTYEVGKLIRGVVR